VWPALSAAVAPQNRKEPERNAGLFDKVDVLPAELCPRIKAEFEIWKKARMRTSGPQRGIT
jgi:hypothetical protein